MTRASFSPTHMESSSNQTFLGEIIMIRPLQDIPFFLNELAYFAQLLRGKTGIEQNAVRFDE